MATKEFRLPFDGKVVLDGIRNFSITQKGMGGGHEIRTRGGREKEENIGKIKQIKNKKQEEKRRKWGGVGTKEEGKTHKTKTKKRFGTKEEF